MTESQNLDDRAFAELFHLLRVGDPAQREAVLTRMIPTMLEALRKQFGSLHEMDQNAAMASAVRTVERREWNLGEEPQDWGELAGKLIVFARNKARNHLRKSRPMNVIFGSEGEGGTSPEPVAPDEAEVDACRDAREQVETALAKIRHELSDLQLFVLRSKYEGLSWEAMKTKLMKEIGMNRTADHLRYQWTNKIAPRLRDILGAEE